jgi:hypothetical protein
LFRPLSSKNHMWRFALFSGPFPLMKTICDAFLSSVQASFHFGKPYIMWCFALCSGLFPLWKTICDALSYVQVSFHFGKPNVKHCPLFWSLSTLETICDTLPSDQASFHFGKPNVTSCPLFRPLLTLVNHMWRYALRSGHFPLLKTTLCPLFRPLSTLENRLWLLVMASSVTMSPQDLSTWPTLCLEKVSRQTGWFCGQNQVFRSAEDRKRHNQTGHRWFDPQEVVLIKSPCICYLICDS